MPDEEQTPPAPEAVAEEQPTPELPAVGEEEYLTAPERARRKLAAKRRLWSVGDLRWKFPEDRPWTRGFYNFVRDNWGVSPYLILEGHRRSGKSTAGLIVCLEEALRAPNTSVAVLCKTKEQARAIIEESFAEVLLDCPKEFRPRRIKNDFVFVFDHNGSKITILAADALNATKARGRKFKFVLVTEFAFIPGVRRIVTSIFAPTLRDVTGKVTGTMLLESTPPDETCDPSDAEDFDSMVAEAELDGRLHALKLSDNKHASPAFIEAAVKDCGGRDSVTFLREYELQSCRESATTAIPEATMDRLFKGDEKKKLPPIVREVARPRGADRYASMDPGGRDLTALLWGFYLFAEDTIVIEDEEALVNMTTDDLAAKVVQHERALWGENPNGKLLRVADPSNTILLYDLLKLHKLRFHATSKDNRDAQINALRLLVRDGRIVIHPRCVKLIKTLRLARRAKEARRGFEHLEKEGLGHADLLDALIYLVRNVRRHKMPEDEEQPTGPVAALHQTPPTPPTPQAAKELLKALRRGR